MRVNKYISEAGLCSRREADELLLAGRVTINDELVSAGAKALDGDVVRVDGEVVVARTMAPESAKTRGVYIALYKPVGITCTTDQTVDGNIVDFVDHPQRIFPIGRLDKDSEGLILLTSNGDIVNEILRSENHHEKEYLVAVNKAVTDEFIRGMAKGVRVHNQMTDPCRVRKIAKFGFSIVLTQGLNRQIRLMAAAFGYRVTQLRRVRIINVKLGHLKPGQWRNLTEAELQGLLPERTRW
ncbi:23S rRNA pseudouridine2604 synthase [Luteibacter sp. OK325]|uniref:pseudouridine synthase n=1 Tax=Luteibacter sp. OK325 TaxID=2135670 RepID=UPI000D3B50B2|nr:pseudouridine synthase [Luteibacter sp. OK325]PTR35161.1 23S rRNA pseudouridine2604 synthase [Luteibacter sp. OK325]